MLHLDLFQSLIGNLAQDVLLCGIRGPDYLRGRLRRLGANFAGLRVLATTDRVWRVLHLVLSLQCWVVVRLLLVVRYNGLVRLEVFPNPLINGLLADLVVIGRLHLDHVFQVVQISRLKLRVLRVSTPARELLVNIDASIPLSLRCYFQRRLVL